MPRVVFTDDLEKRLIELWAEYQRNKSGKMKKRSLKEKEMTAKINLYAKELDGADAPEFEVGVIHNKIDNVKSKAREHYRKYLRETATGSSAADPGSDAAYDLESAYANWGNFRAWHRCFKEVPGHGPLLSINTATISSQCDGNMATIPTTPTLATVLPIPAAAATTPLQQPTCPPTCTSTPQTPGQPGGRPPMQSGDTDEENDLDLLLAGSGGQSVSYCPSPSVPSVPTSGESHVYVPGAHGRKRSTSAAALDSDSDVEVVTCAGEKKKKQKKNTKGRRGADAISDTMAVADRMIEGIGAIQTESQKNMQVFMAGMMAEQAKTTQALVQSQMVFLKALFDDEKK